MVDYLIGKLTERRGAGIALVAVTMVALLAAVALAVDVGMLVTARSEAQRLADAAAHAGAVALIINQGDSAQAHADAMAWGANNTIRGHTVEILEEDVDVIPDDWTVRVRVHQTADRGTSVPTYFARVFGVDNVDVTADAAAWAAPANSAGGVNESCLLPLALVDEFEDNNGNGIYDAGDSYDPDNGIGGYDENDHGKLIKLKIHNNDELTGPPACETDATDARVSNDIDYCQDGGDSSAWRCWWRESEPSDGGGGGTEVLGPRIYPGADCPTMSLQDTVWAASASGNKQSLVTNDDNENNFESLIRSDETKRWCPECAGGKGCVEDTGNPGVCFEGNSGRIRTSPIVDPTIDAGGAHTFSTINDFIGVFVEQVSCSYAAGPYGGPEGRWNVYVRLIVAPGSGSTGEEGSSEESLLRQVQIIE